MKRGEGPEACRMLLAIKAQKSFELLWKSYAQSEKKAFKDKLQSAGITVD